MGAMLQAQTQIHAQRYVVSVCRVHGQWLERVRWLHYCPEKVLIGKEKVLLKNLLSPESSSIRLCLDLLFGREYPGSVHGDTSMLHNRDTELYIYFSTAGSYYTNN